jgi:hypothetical protein
MQLLLVFFSETEIENNLCSSILEKINNLMNSSPVCSPELIMVIYTWFGILAENKLLSEAEQSYAIALLIIHKIYGDPRGRGGRSIPWELFITWRLSIIARL